MLRILLFWSDDQALSTALWIKVILSVSWKQTVGLFHILLHILPIRCKSQCCCGKSASLQCNSRHISKTYVIPDIFHIPYSCLQVRKHYPPECKYMRSLMKSTARTTCHEVTSAWLCTWVPWWQRCEWHLCLCQRETCQPTQGSRHRTNKSGRNKERELI